MLDIHTHLFWKSYDADRDSVVDRARQTGVTKMICVGTEPKDNPQVLIIAEQYEDVSASVGLHPHFFNELAENNGEMTGEIEALRNLAQHRKVVAIGECGLDYFSHDQTKIITGEQKRLQKKGFLAQLELAQELKLAVIIHCRDAYEDMFEILKNHLSASTRGESLTTSPAFFFVLHCYMGDTEMTKKFLSLSNVYFSFTGNITYPVKKAFLGTKDDLTETVKHVPLDRIFTETDCPFLAPQSKRGERNEPAYVSETLECLAELKGTEVSILEQEIENNFKKVFTHL